ncbi:helix-turn-helix domain-containing protein [Actinoplanes sp. NPDC026619]|uniref:helix-turn-helix domain-containing protein n=1 Tax=Actinoplanes sp. NPDC026619 TaxID=3155798 RepID=UPI0033FB1A64
MTPPAGNSAGFIPEVFTIDEAAEILRVKKSWLEKKAAARRIPFTMLGGTYRFSPEHLRRIVAAFEEAPTVAAAPTSQAAPAIRRKRRTTVDIADPRVVPLRARSPRSPRQKRIAA